MAEYIPSEERNHSEFLVAFCTRAAPFASIGLFLSPIPTIRQILKTGTVGDLPLLPYTSMVTSCFVWIIYGLIKGEPLIYGTNLIEFTLSVYYFVEFTNYAPPHSPTFPGPVQRHIQFTVGTCGLALFVALFSSHRVALLGDLTVLLTILTLASPLAAVQAVLESQSSESIPWPFTLAALINCVLWTVVGVMEMHDAYVYFPEILGFLSCSLQVALKLKYHQHDHPATTPNTSRTRTAPYVEMPFPVLERLRQVILLGSKSNHHYATSATNTGSYTAVHLHDDDHQYNGDLALLGDSTGDLDLNEEHMEFSPSSSSITSISQQPPPPPSSSNALFTMPLPGEEQSSFAYPGAAENRSRSTHSHVANNTRTGASVMEDKTVRYGHSS